MNIIKAIKAWWKPETLIKPTIVFRDGVVIHYLADVNETFAVKRVISAYCSLNCERNIITLDNGLVAKPVGQTESYSGMLGQADCFNRNMLSGCEPLTTYQSQDEAFRARATGRFI